MKSLLFFGIGVFSLFANDAKLFTPLEYSDDLDIKKVLLGKMLFTDKALSADGTISCASCHDGLSYGVDNLKTSTGIKGQKGSINAPTTFNARYHLAQFHDGRAEDLAEQAAGPFENPIEMGNTLQNVLTTVKENNFYKVRFKQLYKEGITVENILDAIATFEKALLTPSRFDDYLKGDKTALREVEKEGLELFKSYGCVACHNGINLGGNLFQKLGVFKEYKGSSEGRYNVTKDERDKNYFKVPTLRNIYWTSPYLHDGEIKTLESCIAFMAEYQMGIEIPLEDRKKVESFLHSLTGRLPNVVQDKDTY